MGWFQMPEGTGAISIEQQHFPVVETARGTFFQAPDHFAPRILSLPGFKAAERPPEADERQLAEIDPLRDGAIAELGKKIVDFEADNMQLRSDLNSTSAELRAVKSGLAIAENENRALKNENEELRARLLEFEEAQATRIALAENKKKSKSVE